MLTVPLQNPPFTAGIYVKETGSISQRLLSQWIVLHQDTMTKQILDIYISLIGFQKYEQRRIGTQVYNFCHQDDGGCIDN